MQALGVLVVDRHPVVRHGLSSLLETRVAWTAEAATSSEAWNTIKTSRPGVVVLELELEDGARGIDLCQRLKAMENAPRAVVFTGDASPGAVVAAISAGADSFLHKSVGSAELVDAVERTYDGQRMWMLGKDERDDIDIRSVTSDVSPGVTRREAQVLSLVLRRYTNEEIAGELSLAPQTIKNQVSSALRKLGVSGRRELFRKYSGQGRMTTALRG
ncbi:response regulator transcription factor [Streptomyces sp. SID13726]|uniref:response regulator transcription factor n=1 Tax=Streptomyces sp. SID13726 TaxID=2706058 RepID=UPI0013BBA6D2|nr:response regulator transcription factor [Streptomyces sp. SID13726]NEA97761.1 response regulator transcription factor [Streptomyces sp. SID13726]